MLVSALGLWPIFFFLCWGLTRVATHLGVGGGIAPLCSRPNRGLG